MDAIMALAEKYNLFVVEDAAQAIDSYYMGADGIKRPLGSIGHLGAFSFHETKNIISGEGGMLAINDNQFATRAEIIREKGTNRSAFFRGEVDKYGWVDIGSSFLPSEFNAAILLAQLEDIKKITLRRRAIWDLYLNELKRGSDLGYFKVPYIPKYCQHNAHLFYIICKDLKTRTALIKYLKTKKISANFHYQSLSESQFAIKNKINIKLKESKKYTDCLLRLPLFYELTNKDVIKICKLIINFYKKQS
jgi:dTDP-4-amino-4,6-dideoxygalactose transaminase